MAKRPPMSEDSFLRHLFAPKKNPLPTGLRARPLAFTKGRTKARVAAYNRMSAANQETLKRSGLRESYLRGEASIKQARSSLREAAVGKGIAKPLRGAKVVKGHTTSPLDIMVASHVVSELRKAERPVDVDRVYAGVPLMPDDEKRVAHRWDYARIKAYAGDKSKEIIIEGKGFNPLWYHPS